jgi:hypothetical protein
MLAYLLALTVGLGSFALYMAAFFFPEVHRKNDFIWSGVGLFYALVLWVCAARITGGVLLGQAASVTLLGWLGWQTLLLRRQVAPAEQQTAVPSPEALKETVANLASPENLSKLAGQAGQQATKLKAWGQAKLKPAAKAAAQVSDKVSDKVAEAPYVPLTPADFASADRPPVRDVPAVSIAEPVATTEPPVAEPPVAEPPVPEAIAPEPANFPDLPTPSSTTPSQKVTQKSQPKPADKPTGGLGGAFQQLLGGNKKRESKPVYVRKQFREPDPAETIVATPEPTEAEVTQPEVGIPELTVEPTIEAVEAVEVIKAAETVQVVETVELTVAPIVEDTDLPSDAILESELAYEANHPDLQPTSDEATPQAVPPHPPAAELVEAALMDAEIKDIPASPPAPDPSSTPSSPEAQELD